MDKFEIKTKIEQEFEELSENFVINIAIDQLVYNETYIVLLEHLMQKLKLKGLFISLTKPYETIYNELKQNNLDADSISYIDAVSKETGKFQNKEKVLYLDNPSSITELLFIVKSMCQEGEIKFILLNSLNTLWLYNDIKEVEKFIRSMINHARKCNVSVILTTPKEQSEEDALASITQFCDKEIQI